MDGAPRELSRTEPSRLSGRETEDVEDVERAGGRRSEDSESLSYCERDWEKIRLVVADVKEAEKEAEAVADVGIEEEEVDVAMEENEAVQDKGWDPEGAVDEEVKMDEEPSKEEEDEEKEVPERRADRRAFGGSVDASNDTKEEEDEDDR